MARPKKRTSKKRQPTAEEVGELRFQLAEAQQHRDLLIRTLYKYAASTGAAVRSCRNVVYSCIKKQSNDAVADDTPLNGITNLALDLLAICLNHNVPLKGQKAWPTRGPGRIQGDWTVGGLITLTDLR